MVQPTPWQAGKQQQAQAITPMPEQRAARRRLDAVATVTALRLQLAWLRGHWGYACAAVGNLITFFALFQPWIRASATDGTIKATPFGKFEISSSLVALWSSSPPPMAKINGAWAVLACIAVILTVVLAVLNLRARTQALSTAVMVSSVAMSLFVAFALVHMNRQAPNIRNMVANGPPRDPGSVAGLLIRWASGNSTYALPGVNRYTWATAGLTSWAWFAGGIAIFSALAATAQWARNRRAEVDPSPVRVSLIKSGH
ncbi:hypothetical protein [Nocardia altamirensis]|uniref:hypothetical protein n=1 Tax=Nocardia altamirensis TaxID=472158 RepID=UPI00114D1544|nr:hypothetical protein [Nocardia altamirensis]